MFLRIILSFKLQHCITAVPKLGRKGQGFPPLNQSYDRPWTLFYCDPPYSDAENMYIAQFEKENHKDHKELAGILKAVKDKFILTYNDHPDIWDLYEGLQFKQVEGNYSVSRKADGRRFFGQLLITNF